MYVHFKFMKPFTITLAHHLLFRFPGNTSLLVQTRNVPPACGQQKWREGIRTNNAQSISTWGETRPCGNMPAYVLAMFMAAMQDNIAICRY